MVIWPSIARSLRGAATAEKDVSPDHVDWVAMTLPEEMGTFRNLIARQQPEWPDLEALKASRAKLESLPPLVFAGEARSLQRQLALASEGRSFLLQAGDCAESFRELHAPSIRNKLKIILQTALVLTYGAGLPIVKVGRIAGQFAKPRSQATEVVGGVELPSFRGHIINDDEPTEAARIPDPARLIDAYNQSASTLNLIRAYTTGGFADLNMVHNWNLEFVRTSPEGRRYEKLANEIERALRFMRAIGLNYEKDAPLHEVEFFTSHEALLLDYEDPLTRCDSTSGKWYACSAHFLWVGERTRQLDGAHVAFLQQVHNPIGCKIGPTTTPDEVRALCDALNPNRIPGRLTLISRMGATKVAEALPPLLTAVRDEGHPVVWACDPMHGNTVTSTLGRKTRNFADIVAEVQGFFAAAKATGVNPGGIHLELTGDDVTECLGGSEPITEENLVSRYETICDPRLNAKQSTDLAFMIAELLSNGSHLLETPRDFGF